MKKFSNVAALIAAGALLFGGLFFSCSSDGLPPEIGFESKTKTIENGSAATLNVTGTSVSSSDEKVAKAEIDGTDIKITSVWVGKATITVTDGTDDVTIPVYVKASGDIELGTATKSSASNNGGSVSQKATAATYNFVGLAASDFLDSNGTAVSAWGNSVSWAKGTVNLPAGTTTVKGASVYCKEQTDASKQTLIRARVDDSSVTTALNYNGGIAADISASATISSLDRYVSIPVDGAGTVTASVKFISSSGKSGTLQAGLYDSNGKLLGTVVTADVGSGNITGTESATGTLTGTTTAATTVYLVFSRNGASGGGIDVTKIEVASAN